MDINYEELHEPIIRKFKKRKVHSPFIANIWGADLADTQFISEFNKGLRLLLYVLIFIANIFINIFFSSCF